MGKASMTKFPGDNGQALELDGEDVIPDANLASGRSADGRVKDAPQCVNFEISAQVCPGGTAHLLKIREASVQGQWKTDLANRNDWATCSLSLTRANWAVIWTFNRYLVDDGYPALERVAKRPDPGARRTCVQGHAID